MLPIQPHLHGNDFDETKKCTASNQDNEPDHDNPINVDNPNDEINNPQWQP